MLDSAAHKKEKIRNKRDFTTDTAEIQRNTRIYHGQLYTNKLDNQEEMDKYLETHHLLRVNHDETENQKKLITTKGS